MTWHGGIYRSQAQKSDGSGNTWTYGPFAMMIFSELSNTSLKILMRTTKEGIINIEGGKNLLARFMFEISDALAFMHSKGVIHHDIKPDNILISDNHIRITDFGISAHIVRTEAAQNGTMDFLPPEVAHDDRVRPGETIEDIDLSKKDVFAMGVTAFLMLRKVGQDDSQTYRSAKWRNIVGSKEYIMEISEDQKDALLTEELSHLAGSQALLIVSSMLKIAWQDRCSIQDVRQHLGQFLQVPDRLFKSPDGAAQDVDGADLVPVDVNTPFKVPAVPAAHFEFEPRHWLLSICVWVLRLTPLLLLVALVISRFIVESDDEDVQKADHEFQSMVAATTAAMVSSSVIAGIISAGLIYIKPNLALRYLLIILVMIGTFGIGMFLVQRDVVVVGSFFILYCISQFFTIWSVYTDAQFGILQGVSNRQVDFCNMKLLENLTRFEIFGLIAPTLVFQLGILYAGITVVKQLPTNLWEVIFLAAMCWLVNLPRYLAHFSLVRAMTNAVNLCQRVSYIETLRQVLQNVNSILGWSFLAVQQPFWSVLEMMLRTLLKTGTVLISSGHVARTNDVTYVYEDGSRRNAGNNKCSSACLCIGSIVVPPARVLKRLSQHLSIYCNKFFITMLGYDIELGGGDNSWCVLVDRLKRYSAECDVDTYLLLFIANKSISSSNNANFCILLGCLSALIAAAIYEQAALYGYLAGYLACSTLLEVQSSMFNWFIVVWSSQDRDVCPEVRETRPTFTDVYDNCLMIRTCSFLLQMMNTLRQTLYIINDEFQMLEQGIQPNNRTPQAHAQDEDSSAAN